MNASKSMARLCAGVVVAVAALLATSHLEAAPPVQVTAADPPAAPQGTLALNVAISGSGFDSSAQVEFLVTGTTNPGGVVVKNVKVTGPKKLIATIDVAETAAIDKFDIQVSLSGGRKGKGTSLFAVVAKVSNDPCAAPQIDFPAFTFRGPTEATEEVIYVADASGTCIREIGQFTPAATDAYTTVFSYPVAGTADVGRIAWLEGSDRLIYSLTFLVTGTTVTPFGEELLHQRVGPHIRALDMSKDGSTVYAALDSLDPTDSYRVVAVTVSDRSFRDVYVGPADSSDITSMAVSESGALFVSQEPPNAGVPTDVAWQILRIDPGCATPSCAIVIATANDAGVGQMGGVAASLVDDLLVYEHSGITACSPVLQAISKSGGPVLNSAVPFYGRRSSWYDGKVLTNGIKLVKGRHNCQITSTINQIDPVTGAVKELVRGFDADGR